MNIPAISDDFRFVLWIYTAISSAISVVLLAYTGNYLNFLIRHKVKGEHPGGRVPRKPGIITWTWLLISLIGAGVCTAIASSAPASIGGDRTVIPTAINLTALFLAGFLAISFKIPRPLAYTLFTLFVVSGIFIGIQNYIKYQTINDKTVILVMTLDGEDGNEFTNILFNGLRSEFDTTTDIFVVYSDQTIGEAQGSEYARTVGRQQLADVVFWGWYSSTETNALVNIHVENLNEDLFEDLSVGSGYELNSSLASLNSFGIQQDTTESMRGAILFLGGYARYVSYDFKEALSYFEKALATSTWADDVINRTSALFYLATTQFVLDAYEGALTGYSEVIKNQPDFAAALINRSLILYNTENSEQALVDINKAISLFVKDEEDGQPKYYNKFMLYVNRGAIYASLNQSDSAITDYENAIALAPDNPTAYYNRGVENLRLGNYQFAIADFTKATEKDKHYLDAYHNRGTAYSDLGNLEGAIDDYTTAIEGYEKLINSNLGQQSDLYILQLRRSLAQSYKDRGTSYAKLRKFSQAINDCNKSITYDPNYADAYATLGVIYIDMGNFPAAISKLDKAIELKDTDAIYFFNRGGALLAVGNYPLAKADLLRTLELTEDPFVVTKTEEYLQMIDQ